MFYRAGAALYAKEKIRRHQNTLQSNRYSFLEWLAVLARQRIEGNISTRFTTFKRPAERAISKAGNDAARAIGGLLGTNENTVQALRRRSGDLFEWSTDIDRFKAMIDTGFDGVGLQFRAGFAQSFNIFLA